MRGPIAAAWFALCLASAGCAEDRILQAEAVCGDGRLDPSEQCDIDSPGCAECKVVRGYECTSESCTAKCGDSIVVGQEECDPPDDLSCDSFCRATTKAEACDMTGYWMSRETDFSIDDVVSQVQTSTNWYIYKFLQTGSTFVVENSLFCGVQVSGSVDVALSDGGVRGMLYRNPQNGIGPQPQRTGRFEVRGDGCAFSMDRVYAVRGAEERFLPTTYVPPPPLPSLPPLPFEDNPEHDPSRPFGQNTAGATDDDGDGQPGLVFVLSGILTGRRNVAQRDWKEFFYDPKFPIRQNSIEFVTRGTFDNQESVLHVSDCPALGCGLLTGYSRPAQNLNHRATFRYLGKDLSDARVAAVVKGELRKDRDRDFETCANVRAGLPHDRSKE